MVRKIIQNFIKTVQKILITAALFILYIVGFGITLIFVIIFNRKLLGGKEREKDTFWKDAKGYETDINEHMRES